MIESIDSSLINKCLNNDRAAQKLLYHYSVKYLNSIAFRYSRDFNSTQDILQNTYIKIFTNLKSYDSTKGSFKSWASRIVVIEFLQINRKKIEESLPENVESILSSTEAIAIEKLTIEEIQNVINSLPESHRIILNLYYMEDYNHNEIAEALGIKSSSSRARLSRSRAIFSKKWNQLNRAVL